MAKRRSIEARLEPRQMPGLGEIVVGHDDQIARALHRQLLAGARQQAPAHQDVVAAVREIDPHTGGVPHDALSLVVASASSARATTSPIGPLPLSTTRSAWA